MTVNVDEYIGAAPTEQRPLLREVDAAIRLAHPEATLDPKSYFPVYAMDGHWLAGLASRKKGAMFYCMDAPLLDEYADRLGKNRSGKTCVEYRATRTLSLEELRVLMPEILARQAKRYADGTGGYVQPY
jgi:uncharacterized protein YdhG (YjbR/CyaY superfamily)